MMIDANKPSNQESDLKSTRDGFGAGLIEAAIRNKKVVALSADLADSTRVQPFAQRFRQRYFEVGVAEQNLIGVAAGMAMSGLIPFTASYACFSPANSWGVIRTSVCYNNANVKIMGGHAGLSTGPDGATHQSLEDIATMRVLPNMVVLSPVDGHEAYQATLAAAEHDGPVYIRTSKIELPNITAKHQPFVIGQASLLASGSDISLISCGYMSYQATLISENLAARGIGARVINMSSIKPLDIKALENAFKETRLVLTLEDHQIAGGLGSAVAEVAMEAGWRTKFKRLGIVDSFGKSGPAMELYSKYQLDADHITRQIENALR